jgi:hypothetical protein
MLNDPKLCNQSWFHGVVERKEAEQTLAQAHAGTYLFRISNTHGGVTLSLRYMQTPCWAAGLACSRGRSPLTST